MKQKLLPRILLTLLGVALISMGVSQLLLGFWGESTAAVMTNIRREGGERSESVPNRYTYNISYTFTLPDGREINGFTKKVSGPIFLKADGTSTVMVRYLPVLPHINGLEEFSGFGGAQVVLILTGVFLIYFINIKIRS